MNRYAFCDLLLEVRNWGSEGWRKVFVLDKVAAPDSQRPDVYLLQSMTASDGLDSTHCGRTRDASPWGLVERNRLINEASCAKNAYGLLTFAQVFMKQGHFVGLQTDNLQC